MYTNSTYCRKIHIVVKVMNGYVMLFDSTISCPTHGMALIKLVITVAPHNDIWPYGKTYLLIYNYINPDIATNRITLVFRISC